MRSWRWHSKVLLALLAAAFAYWVWPGLSPALAQGDNQYYCAAGHFSVQLPPGWQVVDDSEIRKSISLLRESGKAMQGEAPRYDFGLSPSGRVDEYPYVLAAVFPTGPIAESDVREVVDAISRELRAEMEKTSLYSQISVHDPDYDKASHRLRLDFTGELFNGTRVDGRIYALFVSNGAVFLYCYAPGGHSAEYDAVFYDMVKSVSFDQGYGWESMPSGPGLKPATPGLSSSDILFLLLYLFLAVGSVVGLGAILVLGLRKRRAGDRASGDAHPGVSVAEAESLPRAESSEEVNEATHPPRDVRSSQVVSRLVSAPILDTAPSGSPTREVEYAGFLRRFGAWVLDQAVMAVLLVLLAVLCSPIPGSQEWGRAAPMGFAAVYSTVSLCLFNRTVGMALLRLRVVTPSGNISLGQALGRWAGSIVSGMALGIGYLWIIYDKTQHRAWHDNWSGTWVVVTGPSESQPIP